VNDQVQRPRIAATIHPFCIGIIDMGMIIVVRTLEVPERKQWIVNSD